MSIAEFLATVEGFKGIAPAEIASIARSCRLRNFAAEEYLMRRGEPGDAMHVLQQGWVRVPLFDPAGREKTVFRLGPGEVVGEMALLTGEPRNADVIAEGPVTTVVFERATLDALLKQYPTLASFLTEILGKRLEEGAGITRVGKYRLLSKIGEGASGKVYEGIHPALNRVVAIKMLSHALVYNPQFRDRFLQEARTVASLSHPNIVQVYDIESAYATTFIVMEKLTGTDLGRLLERRGTLPASEAASILRQLASALAYAHGRGFAHRDVKPANVAIDEQGQVKLMDFGLARPIPEDADGNPTTTVDGTPQYLAPETALGLRTDGRVDIYAMGVVAFEMVTGRLPFQTTSVMQMLRDHVRTRPPDIGQLAPDLPEGLATFIRGALVKDPEQRLQDWHRIQELLDLEHQAPDSWQQASEVILRLRYQPRVAPLVEKALQLLEHDFAEINGVEVARAKLEKFRK